MVQPPHADLPPEPYVGLRPYLSQENGIFFGRFEVIEAVADLFHKKHFVAVIGESGSGKSSLVRAGLVPMLKEGFSVDERDNWRCAMMRPGEDPLSSLAMALMYCTDRLSDTLSVTQIRSQIEQRGMDGVLDFTESIFEYGDSNLLIVVDQLEDLFRIPSKHAREETEQFVQLLLSLSQQTLVPIFVVVTLKSEFMDGCKRYKGLNAAVQNNRYAVPPFTRHQYRNLIKEPMEMYGGEPSPRLMGRLLNELDETDIPIPVLQHLLLRIWWHWSKFGESRVIDIQHFEAVHQFERAISFHGERALVGMNKEMRWLMKRMFQCLVEPGPNRKVYGRAIHLSKLEAITGHSRDSIWELVMTFREDNRLFIKMSSDNPNRDPLLELGSESLVAFWPRYSEWCEEEADRVELYKELVRDSIAHEKGEAQLWQGDQLERGMLWLRDEPPNQAWADLYHADGFTAAVDFLEKSEGAGLSMLLSQDTPEENEVETEPEPLNQRGKPQPVAQGPAALGPELPAPAGQDPSGSKYATVPVPRAAINEMIKKSSKEDSKKEPGSESNPKAETDSEEKSSRKTYAAVTPAEKEKEPEPEAPTHTPPPIFSIFESPRGKIMMAWVVALVLFMTFVLFNSVVLPDDDELPMEERVERPNKPAEDQWRLARTAREAGEPLQALHRLARAGELAWPDSQIELGSATGMRQILGPVELAEVLPHAGVRGLDMTSNGNYLTTFGETGEVNVWNLKTGERNQQAMTHTDAVQGAVFNAAGDMALSFGNDDTARLWSLNGDPAAKPLKHNDWVLGGVFTSNGRHVFTYSMDGTARFWNSSDGTPAGKPMEHDAWVRGGLLFDQDQRALTWSDDGSVRIWRLPDGAPVGAVMQHDAAVLEVVFSDDGQTIMTRSDDGMARLWNPSTGAPITPPLVHGDLMTGARLSQDGATVITFGDDSARLWSRDGASLELAHDAPVRDALFGPAGEEIFTCGDDGKLRRWDTAGQLLSEMNHGGAITSARISPASDRIASWSDDGVVMLWDMQNGEAVGDPGTHLGLIDEGIFSRDGRYLFTRAQDGVRMWSAAKGGLLGVPMQDAGASEGMRLSPAEDRLFTWGSEGAVRIWSLEFSASEPVMLSHEDRVNGAEFSDDGQNVVSYSRDARARIWKNDGTQLGVLDHDSPVMGSLIHGEKGLVLSWSENGGRVWELPDGAPHSQPLTHDEAVTGAFFDSKGERVVTYSTDGFVKLWDARGDLLHTMQHEAPVSGAIFSKNDFFVLSWSEDQSARVWRADKGVETIRIDHLGQVEGVILDKDHFRAVSFAEDGSIKIWRIKDGRAIDLKHDGPVRGVQISPNQRALLSFSDDGSARIWDMRSGELLQQLNHQAPIRGAVYSPDGARILSYGEDGMAHLWDAATGENLGDMPHNGWVIGGDFDRNGGRIYTYSMDGSARIWDGRTAEPRTPPMRHQLPILKAQLSHNQSLLLTNSIDGFARVWHAVDGSLAASPMSHQGAVFQASFSPDDRLILTASADGSARIWNLASAALPGEHLPLLAQVASGVSMDDSGNIRIISPEEWKLKKNQLQQIRSLKR